MKRLRLDKRAVVPRRVVDDPEFLEYLAEYVENQESFSKFLKFVESLKKCGNCEYFKNNFCHCEENYKMPSRTVTKKTPRCEFWKYEKELEKNDEKNNN